MKFVICVTKFRPLHGFSFTPTPKRIGNKHCTLNIKSNDEKYFLWLVLARLHPVLQNPERVSKYLQYEHTLNIEGLSFPLPTKDIPKFEKLNPSISINVLSLGPIHIKCPKCRRKPHDLIVCPAKNQNCHYCGKTGHFERVCRLAQSNGLQ